LFLFKMNGFAQVKIPFGKGHQIVYDLKAGTYALSLNGQAVFENVYAVGQDIDSRSVVKRSYAVKKLPGGTLYTVTSGRLQQLFYTYADKDYCVIVVRVAGQACNYLSPLNAAKIGIGTQVLNVPFDNDMWVRYDAPDISKAAFTGSEVTAIYDAHHGVVIGSLEQDVWKTGLQVKEQGLKVYCGFTDSVRTHDKKGHGRVKPVDGYCTSAPVYIGYDKDWRQAMENYAKAFGPRHVSKYTGATPVCWNSWGVIQTKINLSKAKGVVDFFHDSCVGYRSADHTLYIDLDSYWDNMNLVQLTEFAAYCKEKGFKPGIYWAPFVDWGKYDRPLEGSTYSYGETWTRQDGQCIDLDGGRAMDPTHPGTKYRIAHFMRLFREMGYVMVKIDFLAHGALEGDQFYDPTVTTGMQAYRKGMEWLDSMAGKDMLLYAAISPSLATSDYVHVRRIACDAFSSVDHTEYTLNSMAYGWWQSFLYPYLDADHVVFRDASFNANKARFASALVTGTIVVGDDYAADGEWKQVAKKLLQDKELLEIARKGKAFRPVDGNKVFMREDGYVAIFNYDNKEQVYRVPVAKAGTAVELFSKEKVTVTDVLEVKVDAGSAAIYKIGM
jgi:alpha-galactosidase